MSFYKYIDIDIVEAILEEGNGLELAWLNDLLLTGIKVMGNKGRYLQTQRFLDRINPTHEGKIAAQ